MNLKKIVIIACIALGLFTLWFYLRHPLGAKVEIRGQLFRVDVAVTNQEKEKGLGYRDSLCSDCGMLFPYDHKEQYNFWMKGMRFPLDILWIKDHVIVDISPNIPTSSQKLYAPKIPVNKILEINAGTTERLGITIGDTVKFLD